MKKVKAETRLPYLPGGIVVHILAKLPVKSLLQFRCVSKYWRSLISDPKFNLSTQKEQVVVMSMPILQSKYQKSALVHVICDEASMKVLPLPNPLRGPYYNDLPDLRGSCNGLVLVSYDQDLFLWNPSTRWCIKVLSHWCLGKYRQGSSFISGLCYDSSTGDYKAIMVSRACNFAMVGSFGNKTWTEIHFPYTDRILESGPTTNDRTHWLVHRGEDLHSQVMHNLIVSFDPQMNDFVEMPVPQNERIKRNIVHGFGVLGGCLSLALTSVHEGRKVTSVEVFAMRKYGDEASWTSLFIISDLILWNPGYTSVVSLCSTTNGEVLFLWEGEGGVMAYNPERNSYRCVKSRSCRVYCITSFSESVVSPPCCNWETEDYTVISLSGPMQKYNTRRPGVALSK
ncbi:F-box/kelch-repeat protein At3g23880-like [Rhododendron vialii]|uniref:F-box/kelch-repeat protein At3g23880-like n=1 Tax=Rhododendron vialii TaxID=182163 RepID=UPI00265E748C|nr:F-box/kelch-repeat protein At3g23880-like [Rhododendron vialii]XP_058181506.1 F-box/kelch-repeat protein At3g23880-like [Rhododendron vialii]